MKLFTAPEHSLSPQEPISVFLAGSIEMDKASDWQERVISELGAYPVELFNPRRADWDSSWKQEAANPHFHQQVSWELHYLERVDLAFFFLEAGTLSPISLMELGFICNGETPAIVVCEPGFWRRGNVEIMCERYDLILCETLEEGLHLLKQFVCDESHGCAH